MALVKCPDCGKMVSEKVEFCPFCGCPKEYLIIPSTKSDGDKVKQGELLNKELKRGTDREQKNIEAEKISFIIGVGILKYPKTLSKFAAMFGDYQKIGENAFHEALKLYEEAGSLGNAVDKVNALAEKKIAETVSTSVKLLYDNKIIITEEQFCDKYEISFQPYLVPIMNQYNNVIEQKREMLEQRATEKASRGRWEGGGFGLKGAIKGAVTAGALNMGSDLLHSFGDASRASKDNAKIQNKLNEIYKNSNSKIQLCEGVYICIKEIYNGLLNELKKTDYFEETFLFEEEEEKSLFQATMQYAVNDKEKASNLLKCLSLYPGDKNVIDELITLLVSFDSPDQLGEWLEFWHLDYWYSGYKEKRAKGKEFDAFLAERGMEKFNLRDCNIENYLELRKWIYEYYETHNVEKMPEYSFFAKSIENYYKNITGAMTFYECIEWVPCEYDIFDFMLCMRKEREGLVNSCLSDLWLYGDNIFLIPEKIRNVAINDKVNIIIYYDNSMFGNGGKGILVTTNYFYDLKSHIRIGLSEAENIICYDNGSIEILKGKQRIVFKDDILEDESALNHLRKLFIVLCVRYAANSKLWVDKMKTPRPIGDPLPIEYREDKEILENKVIDDESKCVDGFGHNKKIFNEEEIYIATHFDEGTKIKAIKWYRNKTGADLKEAKEVVDKILINAKEIRGLEDKRKDRIVIQKENDEIEYISCPYCSKKINKMAKFCNFCGAKIEDTIICKNCGKVISSNVKFCNFCGQQTKEE